MHLKLSKINHRCNTISLVVINFYSQVAKNLEPDQAKRIFETCDAVSKKNTAMRPHLLVYGQIDQGCVRA